MAWMLDLVVSRGLYHPVLGINEGFEHLRGLGATPATRPFLDGLGDGPKRGRDIKPGSYNHPAGLRIL